MATIYRWIVNFGSDLLGQRCHAVALVTIGNRANKSGNQR